VGEIPEFQKKSSQHAAARGGGREFERKKKKVCPHNNDRGGQTGWGVSGDDPSLGALSGDQSKGQRLRPTRERKGGHH